MWSSLRIKRRYIEEDEFDRGVRNVLNYGHTFAHAFESATNYAIPHGIAVTMGVACATYFSEELGLAPRAPTTSSWRGCDPILRDTPIGCAESTQRPCWQPCAG